MPPYVAPNQLEQEYRSGFVMYESKYNGTKGELKLCELCTRWFFRETKLERSVELIDGKKVVLIRRIGSTACDRCAAKLAEHGYNLADFMRAEQAFREIKEEVKEQRLRYRRVGAPHPKPSGREQTHIRKTRGKVSWFEPLREAFKANIGLTSTQISAIVGSRRASVVTQVRKVGFALVVVNKVYTGHRPQNVYALAD